MAYRAPRFSYVHAAREVGASAITVSDTADTDFPKDNLIDDRAGTLFKWSEDVTNPTIDIDLGVGFDTGLSRLIIPANHNIPALQVYEDDNAGFSSATTIHALDTDPVEGEQIDITLDTPSSEQYIRLLIAGTDTFYLPQLFLTKIITLDIGPVLANAPDRKNPNVTRLVQDTGLSPTVQHGPDQRYLEYDYEYPLSDEGSSTDLTDIEALIDSVGMYRPFFVDPASFSTPPETDEPVLWMKFDRMPEPRLAVDVPMNDERRKLYTLRLIESLD